VNGRRTDEIPRAVGDEACFLESETDLLNALELGRRTEVEVPLVLGR
jgi:hypothetical protein